MKKAITSTAIPTHAKIDPAAAAMLTYVRDDIASENNLELQ